MATWVEDITQALINLGGQGTLKQIYQEVLNIRTVPLPKSYSGIIRYCLEIHSSDSLNYKGKKDLFQRVDKGIWALREKGEARSLTQTLPTSLSNGGKSKVTATWVEDIIHALKNLGGQATLKQIYDEVERIRQGYLPKRWQHIIQDNIYQHSSDTQKFQGNDLFKRVGKGTWALKSQYLSAPSIPTTQKNTDIIPHNYLPSESIEEIENILRTIKQYRDYQHPDSQSWKEYVDEFFHILGFSTEEKGSRLMTISLMGVNHTSDAIVCYVKPGENFDEIIPGLEWKSYVFYATKYHKTDWGIITDGIRMMLTHYIDQNKEQQYYWPNFDEVICQEKLDTFCTIYKVFSFIKGYGQKPINKLGRYKKPQRGQSNELAERHVIRLKFWEQLLEKAKTMTKLHAKVSPGIENWISAGGGKTGLYFNYVIRMDDAQVELYIDRGKIKWNKTVYNYFLQQKTEIEQSFGEPLDWQLLPDKQGSRIRYVISGIGLKDQDQWDQLQELLIDAMIRLEKAFRVAITNIPKYEE